MIFLKEVLKISEWSGITGIKINSEYFNNLGFTSDCKKPTKNDEGTTESVRWSTDE